MTIAFILKYKASFQPTPPARTETDPAAGGRLCGNISTHSAREDGDASFCNCSSLGSEFQPTPPARTETAGEMALAREYGDFNPLRPRGRRRKYQRGLSRHINFNPLRPRGRRQQYYTKKPTILHHISTIKSHHTPSNHRQPTLHTSKTVLIVQFFRCESPRKFMFASGSHQTI